MESTWRTRLRVRSVWAAGSSLRPDSIPALASHEASLHPSPGFSTLARALEAGVSSRVGEKPDPPYVWDPALTALAGEPGGAQPRARTIGQTQPTALTCQPRSRKLTYSSCFLQACLWSLLLFSALTGSRGAGQGGGEGRKHARVRVPSVAGNGVSTVRLRKLAGDLSDAEAVRVPAALKLTSVPDERPTRDVPAFPQIGRAHV